MSRRVRMFGAVLVAIAACLVVFVIQRPAPLPQGSTPIEIGINTWVPVVGLALGGAVAAPISAILAKRIPARPLMIVVGVLVIVLSLRTIFLALR